MVPMMYCTAPIQLLLILLTQFDRVNAFFANPNQSIEPTRNITCAYIQDYYALSPDQRNITGWNGTMATTFGSPNDFCVFERRTLTLTNGTVVNTSYANVINGINTYKEYVSQRCSSGQFWPSTTPIGYGSCTQLTYEAYSKGLCICSTDNCNIDYSTCIASVQATQASPPPNLPFIVPNLTNLITCSQGYQGSTYYNVYYGTGRYYNAYTPKNMSQARAYQSSHAVACILYVNTQTGDWYRKAIMYEEYSSILYTILVEKSLNILSMYAESSTTVAAQHPSVYYTNISSTWINNSFTELVCFCTTSNCNLNSSICTNGLNFSNFSTTTQVVPVTNNTLQTTTIVSTSASSIVSSMTTMNSTNTTTLPTSMISLLNSTTFTTINTTNITVTITNNSTWANSTIPTTPTVTNNGTALNTTTGITITVANNSTLANVTTIVTTPTSTNNSTTVNTTTPTTPTATNSSTTINITTITAPTATNSSTAPNTTTGITVTVANNSTSANATIPTTPTSTNNSTTANGTTPTTPTATNNGTAGNTTTPTTPNVTNNSTTANGTTPTTPNVTNNGTTGNVTTPTTPTATNNGTTANTTIAATPTSTNNSTTANGTTPTTPNVTNNSTALNTTTGITVTVANNNTTSNTTLTISVTSTGVTISNNITTLNTTQTTITNNSTTLITTTGSTIPITNNSTAGTTMAVTNNSIASTTMATSLPVNTTIMVMNTTGNTSTVFGNSTTVTTNISSVSTNATSITTSPTVASSISTVSTGNTTGNSVTTTRNTTAATASTRTTQRTYPRPPGSCFTGTSRVRRQDGSLMMLRDVHVGDRLLDATGKYSPVLTFFVRQQHGPSIDYLRISTTESTLEITPSHLILMQHHNDTSPPRYLQAQRLRPGDSIFIMRTDSNGVVNKTQVIHIDQNIKRTDAFAPLLQSGTLVVDDMIVSCYAQYEYHSLIHLIMFPFRLWETFKHETMHVSEEKELHPYIYFWLYLSSFLDLLIHNV